MYLFVIFLICESIDACLVFEGSKNRRRMSEVVQFIVGFSAHRKL